MSAEAFREFFGSLQRYAWRAAEKPLRGLRKQDAGDVFGWAVLGAFQERSTWRPDQPIEDWFIGFVRRERSKLRSEQRRDVERGVLASALEDLVSSNDTEHAAEVEINAERLITSLSDEERNAAELLATGHSVRHVATVTKLKRGRLRSLKRRLRGLKDISERAVYQPNPRHPADSDSDERPMSGIDHEIEKLLRRPKTDKADCPACWKCKYFAGVQPDPRHFDTDRRVFEREAREAITNTAHRKIEIAAKIRADGGKWRGDYGLPATADDFEYLTTGEAA